MNEYRNSNRNATGSDGVLLVIVIGAIFLLALVLAVAETLGIDRLTAAKVAIPGLLLIVGFAAMCWKKLEWAEMTWPVALGLLWCCFWPALEYHSNHGIFGPGGDFEAYARTRWFAAWYTKWGVLLVLIGGGYYLRSFINERREMSRY